MLWMKVTWDLKMNFVENLQHNNQLQLEFQCHEGMYLVALHFPEMQLKQLADKWFLCNNFFFFNLKFYYWSSLLLLLEKILWNSNLYNKRSLFVSIWYNYNNWMRNKEIWQRMLQNICFKMSNLDFNFLN